MTTIGMIVVILVCLLIAAFLCAGAVVVLVYMAMYLYEICCWITGRQ